MAQPIRHRPGRAPEAQLPAADAPQVVSIDQIRNHLRLESSLEEDVVLARFQSALPDAIGLYLGRPFAPHTRLYRYAAAPRWAEILVLPDTPVRAVTRVTAIGADGVAANFAAPKVYGLGEVSPLTDVEIAPAIGGEWDWPANGYASPYPVEVECEVGWASPPPPIVEAALAMVADWYVQRRTGSPFPSYHVPRSAGDLLNQYRVPPVWFA